MEIQSLVKSFLLATVAGGIALSANAQTLSEHWINEGNPFTSDPVGQIPDGWAVSGTRSAAVTDDTVLFGGNDSVVISGGSVGIFRPGSFDTSGEFNWMFYDDMAASKNTRVGLMRPADNNDGAPRFGAIAVEGSQSATHYVAHIGFSFAPTSVARTEGWRHMQLAWDVVGAGTEVRFFIDGELGHVATHAAAITPTNEWIGAPFANATEAWVNTIPEPSTYAAIFGGLALVGAIGYRRRLSVKK